MTQPAPTTDQLLAMIATLQDRLDQYEHQAGPAPPAVPVPVPVPVQTRNLKPERPSAYTGKRGDSLESWIFQMERYCQLLPVPADDRVSFAGTFLKDHAAMWWRTTYQEIEAQPQATRWDRFTESLRAQFQPINTAETARSRLDQLKQKTSVLLYNTEFRDIMLQLPDMHEADRVHAYIKGLKAAVASQVAMHRPETLLQAQELADTADTIHFQHFSRRNYQESPRPRQDYRGPAPMDLDAINKLTDVERERLRKNGGCFRCRKLGHLARDCTMTNRVHPRINAIEEIPEESGKE